MRKILWQSALIIVFTLAVGSLSGFLGGNMRQTYHTLTKPPLSPPSWLFGVVWSMLYLLMGIAASIIYQLAKTKQRSVALGIYSVQLLVNFLWSIIFFRFGLHWWAVGNIMVLNLLVFILLIRFYRMNRLAGCLLMPYFAWILFATYLNISIALLN